MKKIERAGMKVKDLRNTYSGFMGPEGFQAVLTFDKKYDLSIVKHKGSYGGDRGLYEIAVFKDFDKGNSQVELPGITEEGDTVRGFLTENDVDCIIKKMHLVTGSTPKQKV